MKYLYGASVQGIQKFIFETNKLKEIVGASELVEQICTKNFADAIGKKNNEDLDNDPNAITNAAGNIKYLFDSKELCENVVFSFPKDVMEKAPGITISQAVIPIELELKADDFNRLEDKLKIQRNKIEKPLHQALMISERARKTGNSGAGWDKNESEVIDFAQVEKRKTVDASVVNLSKKLTGEIVSTKDFNYEVEDIAHGLKGSKNWIAVIHADGNNLGKLIQKMAENLKNKNENEVKSAFKEFSQKLDKATTCAAQTAYNEVVLKAKNISKIPIRPIVIGGDDLTVIIRGDLALDFTTVFLKQFEIETAAKLDFENGLTACAGIAYIKPTYPFHYAVHLAEELCTYSKKVAKDLVKNDDKRNPSSCIMFHKVQSSFIGSFKEDIIDRELKAGEVFFNYGPYFIQNQEEKPTVSQLKEWIKQINREDAPKSGLRNWLGELHHSSETAQQIMDRIKSLNNHYVEKLNLKNPIIEVEKEDKKPEKIKKTHIHDVLALSNLQKSE